MSDALKELHGRLIYNADRSECCKAGGGLDHPNYGLPCVTGAVYWPDSWKVTICTNCVFCGRENEN